GCLARCPADEAICFVQQRGHLAVGYSAKPRPLSGTGPREPLAHRRPHLRTAVKGPMTGGQPGRGLYPGGIGRSSSEWVVRAAGPTAQRIPPRIFSVEKTLAAQHPTSSQ